MKSSTTPPTLLRPTVINVRDGSFVNTPLLALTGTGSRGSTITVSYGQDTLGTTTVWSDGTWATTADISHLSEGTQWLTVTGALPGARSRSVNVQIVIDRSIRTPRDITVTYTDERPVVSGHADPFSTVRVQGPHTAVTVAANSRGEWATQPLTTPPAGYSTVTATAMDGSGNMSPPSAPIPIRVGAGGSGQ